MRAGAGLPQLPDTYWRSLRYFSVYRLIVAGLFFFAAAFYGGTPNLGSEDIRLFRWVSTAYLLVATAILWSVVRARRAFNMQLTVQVAVDVVALTLLMYASGGAKSGIGVMMFVVLAGAGLVGQGRMTLFYAALATLAVLIEQAYHFIRFEADPGGFFRTGLTSIGFFGTAIAARLLARRIVANEALAWQRGVELTNQLQINQRVIRDMQDGVLVIDAEGRVRQHNPQAEVLLDVHPGEGADLATYSVALSEQFALWSKNPVETETYIHVAGSQRILRARLLPPGEGERALIYLEDMGRVQQQAQQIKLAALGRLTANMAHEIRNPLSAISHAAELLVDEQRGDGQARLIRIIGDNTRRLNRLVAEVLELGRRDRAHVEPIRLAAYLQQFIDDFAVNDATVRERVVVAVDGDAMILFDRTHFHRVLWNLVVNALRHCSAVAGAVRLSAQRMAGGVELHVVDDGAGIGESLRGQVFEPFFTTHGSGTGLGLYIARELCEANGARIDLRENSPGAHFIIIAKAPP
ncbi:MAG: HAMP domain-containing sensor histidine kinase [Rhodocyclaceae bacterium]|nr:HAMP domain-containing sensor histidine kinase [Rhodocyclaceae bacterium]